MSSTIKARVSRDHLQVIDRGDLYRVTRAVISGTTGEVHMEHLTRAELVSLVRSELADVNLAKSIVDVLMGTGENTSPHGSETTYRAFCHCCGWSSASMATEEQAENEGDGHEIAMVRSEPDLPNGTHRTYVSNRPD